MKHTYTYIGTIHIRTYMYVFSGFIFFLLSFLFLLYLIFWFLIFFIFVNIRSPFRWKEPLRSAAVRMSTLNKSSSFWSAEHRRQPARRPCGGTDQIGGWQMDQATKATVGRSAGSRWLPAEETSRCRRARLRPARTDFHRRRSSEDLVDLRREWLCLVLHTFYPFNGETHVATLRRSGPPHKTPTKCSKHGHAQEHGHLGISVRSAPRERIYPGSMPHETNLKGISARVQLCI